MIRKLLIRFGYIPRSLATELSKELDKSFVLISELRAQAEKREQRIEQLITDCARLRSSHEELKQTHEAHQRAQAKLAQALSGRIPITMNGIRR